MPASAEQPQLDWPALMEQALNAPGAMNDAYSRFHNYSFLNQVFLLSQGCPLEPVASFQRWKAMDRQVQRGSSAYYVVRPITVKLKDQLDEHGEPKTMMKFKPVKGAFPVSMTEGKPLPEYEPSEWSVERALGALAISRVPFESYDGNMQGYSFERNIAINPVAKYPLKTTVHELGHVMHGHTTGEAKDLHRGVAEFQAESTAYLALHELNATDQMDASASRSYIQTWLRGEKPDDKHIRAVFRVTNDILRAGRLAVDAPAEVAV